MTTPTENELELSARLTAVEYLLQIAYQTGIAQFSEPDVELADLRKSVIGKLRGAATIGPGPQSDANVEVCFEIQRRAIAAMERWFDRVAANLPR